MDFYRIAVVKEGIRRVVDLPASELPIVTQQATRDGWQVSFVLLPADVELIPGIMEEPTDLPKH
jgi:hypothetical protein